MDTTLVTVTILSMGMAAALSVIVWRLLRDERRRSEARIAALTEASRLSLQPRGGTHTNDVPVSRPGLFKPEVFKPVASKPAVPVAAGPSERPRGEGLGLSERPRVEVKRNAADDLPLHTTGAPVSAGALFVEPERTSPWGNRFAVMAGLALAGAAIVLFALTATGTRTAAPAKNAVASATPSAAEPAVAGLELLELRDARQDDALTISGMVQNPRDGSLRSRVAVTAYAFDEKGTFLASGRALLDVTSLAPGDESPFLVKVPVTGAVARYRIGFRSEDGRVIAHVDKRQQAPMAALRQPNG